MRTDGNLAQGEASLPPCARGGGLSSRFMPLLCLCLAVWVFCRILFEYTGISVDLPAAPPLVKFAVDTYNQLVEALLLVVVVLKHSRWKGMGVVGVAAMGCVLLNSRLLSTDTRAVVLFLFLLAVQGEDLRPLIATFLASALVVLVLVMLSTRLLGTREIWERPNGFWVSGYGFGHPNVTGYFLFGVLVAMVLLFERSRVWVPLMLLCVASAVAMLVILSCRTGFVLTSLLAIVLLAEQRMRRLVRLVERERVFSVTLIVGMLLMVAFMLVTIPTYTPENPVLSTLNKLTNGRLSWAKVVYDEYGGYTLLGRFLELPGMLDIYHGAAMRPLDNMVARHAMDYGLLRLACFVVVYIRAVVRLSRRRPTFVLWSIVLLYLAYSVSEYTPAMSLYFNCTLLYLAEGLAASETGGADPGAVVRD